MESLDAGPKDPLVPDPATLPAQRGLGKEHTYEDTQGSGWDSHIFTGSRMSVHIVLRDWDGRDRASPKEQHKGRHYTGQFRISVHQTARQASRTTLLEQCAYVNSCCLFRPSKVQNSYHLTQMTGVSTHLTFLFANSWAPKSSIDSILNKSCLPCQ